MSLTQGTFSLADELDGVRALGPLEVAYRVSLAEPGSRTPAGIMDHANTIGFRAARSLER